MLSTSNGELPAMGRDEKGRMEQNKQNVKAMTFHFELDQLAGNRSSRRSSIVTSGGPDHRSSLPPNTINQGSDPSGYDDVDMPQRKQQQRRASAKYYIKNKEAIKEKRRMRYWVGILAKIAERNNSGNEDCNNTQQDLIEGEGEASGKDNPIAQRRNSLKETVFVMESGLPRQKGKQIKDEHSSRQQVEEPNHTINQEHPSSSGSGSSAVLFHEQLNAIISDDSMVRRDDLVLGLKPVLEAMLTRMIELEQQQQHQQQTF